ncbi:MAG: hypothetical protein ACTSRG_17230 [Candidatus Helarchaeota archaeon]
MGKWDEKVLIQFIYGDKIKKSIEVPIDSAKELEILATTGVPRRLIKAIIRIGKNLIRNEGVMEKKDILSPSRSGDLYNALKYLIKEKIVEQDKENKKIRVINLKKLHSLHDELQMLIKK